ncbi:RNA-directed DNA polymerase, eukaryota [Tanacetum coccineum]
MGDNAWQKVTRKKSMEDLTQRISKSVFITNFPDHFSARDLWEVCKGYGTVVDVYIPNRKSKAGKRYAFARFIRVDNVERLVSNLCTVWNGRMHMHANVVRFDRSAKPANKTIRTETPAVNTYASVHKGINSNHTLIVSIHSMVLDDSHIVHRDLSYHVIGEAKQFMSIQKLPTILSKEGFPNVKLTYLGGLWVMMESSSLITKEKFLQHVGVVSWFNSLSNAQPDFVSKERIVWVDIEGVPLHLWSHSTFTKIDSKWGELLELEESKDDVFARKRLKENHLELKVHDMDDDTDDDGVSDTYFGHDDRDEQQQQSNQMKQASEDPFQIYDLLKKQDNEVKSGLEKSRSCPPGFTPDADDNKKVEDKVSSPYVGFNSHIMVDSSPIEDQMSSHGVQYSHMNDNKKGGSILEVMDDTIKVGQTMGYTMEGCLGSKAKKDWIKELNVLHKVNCLALQETKMENFSVMEAKYIWGNSDFAYLSSDSIDNFIAVYGTWMPNMSKILIIAIYAPQSVTEKRTLWQYITHLINRWNGECILEDINDMVRFKKKFQGLKKAIREWVTNRKKNHNLFIKDTKLKFGDIDKKLDCGEASDELLLLRMNLMQSLQEKKSVDARDNRQKAKVKWAIEGDKNTKYFHGIINKKSTNLSIRGVMVDGEWIVEPIRVKEAFRNHFGSRFHHPSARRSHINFTFLNRLSQEQTKDLENHVSMDEIRKAVWDCGENKSPGPDGYTFEFFQKFWSLVGPNFCKAIQWFFDHSNFPRGCNSSFIALIPKVPDAKFVSDFRPISLIGSMYKVITKILANRLSSVISDLVSDVQTAFVFNRKILDGPFIINELLSWCKRKKKQAMLFKVDFAKAYDSVRWDFLDDVFRSFGFGSKWRS